METHLQSVVSMNLNVLAAVYPQAINNYPQLYLIRDLDGCDAHSLSQYC